MNKLLDILSRNADFTAAQLATMLGKTEDEIKKEIQAYKDQGIIKGTNTLINWDKVPGSGVMALIELKVTPKPETGFDDIARIVMSFENVESVYLAASSRYDLIATVRGETIQDVAEFVSKRLSTLDNVIGTATSFILTHYKKGGIPFCGSEEEEEQRSMIL